MIQVTQHTKKQISKWIKALRSGQYEQTTGALQNSKGFCCLGVGCAIFIPRESIKLEGEYMEGGEPCDQPEAPEWLRQIDNDFKERTGQSLINCNDTKILDVVIDTVTGERTKVKRLSFNEIADLLQLVYIEGMLDVAEESTIAA